MKTIRLAIIMMVTVAPFFPVAEALARSHTYRSSDVPKPIPDRDTASSSITVPDCFIISDVNVVLDITHRYNEDLDAYLISPDGTQVELFTDVGATDDDFRNTRLDDECTTPITRGVPPFTGCYNPEGNLSDFDGQNACGTWQLCITDDDPGMMGTLNSWSLIIQYAPVARCQDVTVPAEKDCQADVNFLDVDCGSFDFSGDPITLTLDPPSPYPIGVHDVNLIVIDSTGASDSNSVRVTVLPTAYCYKKEVVHILERIRSLNPTATDLTQIIDKLNMSLGKNMEVVWAGPDRVAQWQGGYWYHVDPNMFDYELDACNLVTAYEQNTKTDMKHILKLLAEADKKIADKAISDAVFQGRQPSVIAEAKRLRNQANAAKARGEFCVALLKYIQAWKKAIDSLGPDVDINRDGKVNDLDVDIFVDQWLKEVCRP